jgi:hypothetical protein
MIMKRILFVLTTLLTWSSSAFAQDYAGVSGDDRISYVAARNQQGTTVSIPIADVTRLCGDMDGCTARIAMYNWDGTGRAASREFMLYYNPQNRNWRSFTSTPVALAPDLWGQDNNSTVEHVNSSWTCYMTDGEYSNSTGTDAAAGFGLLFWTQFNAGACWLTLID